MNYETLKRINELKSLQYEMERKINLMMGDISVSEDVINEETESLENLKMKILKLSMKQSKTKTNKTEVKLLE